MKLLNSLLVAVLCSASIVNPASYALAPSSLVTGSMLEHSMQSQPPEDPRKIIEQINVILGLDFSSGLFYPIEEPSPAELLAFYRKVRHLRQEWDGEIRYSYTTAEGSSIESKINALVERLSDDIENFKQNATKNRIKEYNDIVYYANSLSRLTGKTYPLENGIHSGNMIDVAMGKLRVVDGNKNEFNEPVLLKELKEQAGAIRGELNKAFKQLQKRQGLFFRNNLIFLNILLTDVNDADVFRKEFIRSIRELITDENELMKEAGFLDKYPVFPEDYEIKEDNYADVLNKLRIAFAFDIDILLSKLEKTCALMIKNRQEDDNNISIPDSVNADGILALQTSQ